MTHSFNFFGVSEKLFVLQQLHAASRDYCRNAGFCQNSYPYGHEEWQEYEHRIKSIVSSYILEIAAKIRILQDSKKNEISLPIFENAEKCAVHNNPIGKIRQGNFNLTVRESCNKIIHATHVEFDWITKNRRKSNSYTHWSGLIHLFGNKTNAIWHLELDITAWCVAIDDYLDAILNYAASKGIYIS